MGSKEVKLFHINDKSIKYLGHLLSNDTSRAIIMMLSDDTQPPLYINQIVKKLGVSGSLVVYHIHKLKKLGLLTVTVKPISKKTKNHNFYKIRNNVLLRL